MLSCQLGQAQSLREICGGLASCGQSETFGAPCGSKTVNAVLLIDLRGKIRTIKNSWDKEDLCEGIGPI